MAKRDQVLCAQLEMWTGPDQAECSEPDESFLSVLVCAHLLIPHPAIFRLGAQRLIIDSAISERW